jgi:hypothetical protein
MTAELLNTEHTPDIIVSDNALATLGSFELVNEFSLQKAAELTPRFCRQQAHVYAVSSLMRQQQSLMANGVVRVARPR